MSLSEQASGDSPWVVLKFGGTSVSTPERWQTIAGILRERLAEGLRPLVVCSAVRQVSDLLQQLTEATTAAERGRLFAEVVARHRPLAEGLGVPWSVLEPTLAELAQLSEQLFSATALPSTPPQPPLVARVLATGEQLSTALGHAALAGWGLRAERVDARELLETVEREGDPEARRYLRAGCVAAYDPELAPRLEGLGAEVVVTEGFIARRSGGQTVLLGRGGSDTSAAQLAARLRAARCEIWSDVPGLYSANPHLIPGARLLRHLHYAEAEEIALTGARVLHSRCIAPLWEQGIPLHMRSTDHPELAGTIIDGQAAAAPAHLKAISVRSELTLVTMESVGMWHQVGFLAAAFACFERQGLSVDLIATSEANVTVSLDPIANAIDDGVLNALLADLRTLCVAELIRPCAAISLVGRNIRSILHQLAPAFEVFEEERIYLLTQAASDLNLTFVVDDDQAERLTRRLHGMLFSGSASSPHLGATWEETTRATSAQDAGAVVPWWRQRRDELLAVAAAGSPAYVYDEVTVRAAAASLLGLQAVSRVFYAIKANPHPEILRTLAGLGVGFECTSPGELARVRELLPDLAPERLLFTPNFAARREYQHAVALGCYLTLDSLYPLEHWAEDLAGHEVIVRLDPGRGHGHHRHVRTAGARSKFGVTRDQLPRLGELIASTGVRVVGLHAHIGSGVREEELWSETAEVLAGAARDLPDVRILNLGGGLGVPDRAGQAPLDLARLDGLLAACAARNPGRELWLEPGRFLVAGAGVLLTTVTQLKEKPGTSYVGVDAGMNSLIRPALYGASHDIVNLTRPEDPPVVVADIVGPICETGDTLGHARALPRSTEGDVLLIDTAGAYGHSMSSHYNLRAPAREVFLHAGTD